MHLLAEVVQPLSSLSCAQHQQEAMPARKATTQAREWEQIPTPLFLVLLISARARGFSNAHPCLLGRQHLAHHHRLGAGGHTAVHHLILPWPMSRARRSLQTLSPPCNLQRCRTQQCQIEFLHPFLHLRQRDVPVRSWRRNARLLGDGRSMSDGRNTSKVN